MEHWFARVHRGSSTGLGSVEEGWDPSPMVGKAGVHTRDTQVVQDLFVPGAETTPLCQPRAVLVGCWRAVLDCEQHIQIASSFGKRQLLSVGSQMRSLPCLTSCTTFLHNLSRASFDVERSYAGSPLQNDSDTWSLLLVC